MPYRIDTNKGAGNYLRNKMLHNVDQLAGWRDDVTEANVTEGQDGGTNSPLQNYVVDKTATFIQRTDVWTMMLVEQKAEGWQCRQLAQLAVIVDGMSGRAATPAGRPPRHRLEKDHV